MLVRDTFTTAVVKNLIVVLVWLVLSYINGTLVATFFRHQVHIHTHSLFILYILGLLVEQIKFKESSD